MKDVTDQIYQTAEYALSIVHPRSNIQDHHSDVLKSIEAGNTALIIYQDYDLLFSPVVIRAGDATFDIIRSALRHICSCS